MAEQRSTSPSRVNGRRAPAARAQRPAPAGRAARRPAAHRGQGRLRQGRVRRLHGARGRPGRGLVPDDGLPGRRRRGRDHRGPGQAGRAAPAAGRVHREGRRAVRHLHPRHGAGRQGPARPQRPARARGRSARAWPATSAAARATRRSSTAVAQAAAGRRCRDAARRSARARRRPATTGRARSRRPSRSSPSGRARCARWPAAPTSWSRPRTAVRPRRPLRPHRGARDAGHRGGRRPRLDRRRHHPHGDDRPRRSSQTLRARAAHGCAWIGGPQIRNRGTLGGNLANASPAARHRSRRSTWPTRSWSWSRVSARREVPIAEFFTGPRQSVLARDELIVGRAGPQAAGGAGGLPAPRPAAGPGDLQGLGGGGHDLQGRPARLGRGWPSGPWPPP